MGSRDDVAHVTCRCILGMVLWDKAGLPWQCRLGFLHHLPLHHINVPAWICPGLGANTVLCSSSRVREVDGEESLGLLHSLILCSLSSFLFFHADTYRSEEKKKKRQMMEWNRTSYLYYFSFSQILWLVNMGLVRWGERVMGRRHFSPPLPFYCFIFAFHSVKAALEGDACGMQEAARTLDQLSACQQKIFAVFSASSDMVLWAPFSSGGVQECV